MYNKHKDEFCVIIGNGPSLKNVSNKVLERLPSFGSNGILLRFTPTYFVAVNPLAIERFAALIDRAATTKFLKEGTPLHNYTPLHSMRAPLFSYDPLHWIYEGYTVTFASLQLAFYMGFRAVYLFGVDHRYVFEGAPNEEHTFQGDDPNHFAAEYFKDAKWNNPDLARSEAAYQLAEEAYKADGRQIWNCTEDSALEVFQKKEIPSWFLQ